MPKQKIEPEPGAASILVQLSGSKVTVRHGDHQTASYGILIRPHKVHKGFWDGLFDYLKGRKGIKTANEIETKIKQIEQENQHLLTGSTATIAINAPRALMQLSVETRLQTLHWILGTEYKSTLKGVDC